MPNACATTIWGMPRWTYFLSLFCLLCFTAFPAVAQFDTGTISGLAVDPSGAAIPHAAVTVMNMGTNRTSVLTTNGAGGFSASDLPFGAYTVTANAPGFGATTSKEILLTVGAAVHVTLRLSVATASQSVDVTGTETAVNTETTTTGTTLNAAEVENLPINGRDVSDFLEISPGSVFSTGDFQGSINGLENIFTGLNITLDGQNSSRGDINGFLMTEGQEASHVTRASIDCIEEIDFSTMATPPRPGTRSDRK